MVCESSQCLQKSAGTETSFTLNVCAWLIHLVETPSAILMSMCSPTPLHIPTRFMFPHVKDERLEGVTAHQVPTFFKLKIVIFN